MMANNESLDVYGMKINKLFDDLVENNEDLDITKEAINKLTENLQNIQKKLKNNCPEDDYRPSFIYSWS